MHGYLDGEATLEYLATKGVRLTRSALEKRRQRGTAPPYRIALGKAVSSREEVDEWLERVFGAPPAKGMRRQKPPARETAGEPKASGSLTRKAAKGAEPKPRAGSGAQVAA